jgi:predicted  nucleic acid-binding Zn-ribbon protein
LDQLAFERLRQTRLAHERLSDLSWELEDLEQRLRELEGQGPGSGDVLLDREVMRLRQRHDLLEDDVLEQMLQTDELDRDLLSERAKLARQTSRHTGHVQRLQQLIERVEQRLAALDAQRAVLVVQLPPPLLARYEALRATTHNTPVAGLRDGHCEVCGGAALMTPRDAWGSCAACGRLLIPV